MLLGLADRLPGARVLDDRLDVVQLALALPKGSPTALAYVTTWMAQARRSGLVQRAIDAAGLRGVQAAPAARERPGVRCMRDCRQRPPPGRPWPGPSSA